VIDTKDVNEMKNLANGYSRTNSHANRSTHRTEPQRQRGRSRHHQDCDFTHEVSAGDGYGIAATQG